jgi:hypothetical protein
LPVENIWFCRELRLMKKVSKSFLMSPVSDRIIIEILPDLKTNLRK